jgi:hypothetical protein
MEINEMFELHLVEKMQEDIWQKVIDLEPDLFILLLEAGLAGPKSGEEEGFDWEAAWRPFEREIAELVGVHRVGGDPMLRTAAAYDVVYWKLWHALHN